MVDVPDEQLAFEDWAVSQGFDMLQHPLHYLFLNAETNAARRAWKAAWNTRAIPAEVARCEPPIAPDFVAALVAEVAALRDALAKEEERGRGWCNDALEAQEQVAALKREVERLREAIHNLRGIPDGARLCEVSLDAYCEAQRAAGPLAHKEPGDEG